MSMAFRTRPPEAPRIEWDELGLQGPAFYRTVVPVIVGGAAIMGAVGALITLAVLHELRGSRREGER